MESLKIFRSSLDYDDIHADRCITPLGKEEGNQQNRLPNRAV